MQKKEIISIAFIVSLLISNILATKLIQFGNVVLPAAVIVYPFCFMLGDVLTEVWGYQNAKRVIITGFAANLCLILFIYIGQLLPPAEYWTNQQAYETIFGLVPRIVTGSFVAYLIGELINSWVLDQIKKVTGLRLLFVRTIGSSVVGQLFDTGIFISIAFYGLVPNNVLFGMLLAQYVTKILIEAIGGTPLAYLLVGWARGNNDKTMISSTAVVGS